jgi:hypothetical protein
LAGVGAAFAELFGQPLGAVAAGQVEVAGHDPGRFLHRFDPAVNRLNVLGLEMVVDDHVVMEALADQRAQNISEHRVQGVLVNMDRSRERRRVAGHSIGERGEDQRPQLWVADQLPRSPLTHPQRDQGIGAEWRVGAVGLGRTDRPQQHHRSLGIEQVLDLGPGEVGEVKLLAHSTVGSASKDRVSSMQRSALPAPIAVFTSSPVVM